MCIAYLLLPGSVGCSLSLKNIVLCTSNWVWVHETLVQIWLSKLEQSYKSKPDNHRPLYGDRSAHTPSAVMHESQIYPSDSRAAACLLKPVVFQSLWKQRMAEESHEPPPRFGAAWRMCTQQDVVWSLLRTSLVKIYSQSGGVTRRQEDRRMTGAGFEDDKERCQKGWERNGIRQSMARREESVTKEEGKRITEWTELRGT